MFRLTESVGGITQTFEAPTLIGVMDLYKTFEEHQRWLKTPKVDVGQLLRKQQDELFVEPDPNKGRKVWKCKIGGFHPMLPPGADAPMRRAVETAYRNLTGESCEFTFSGWGAKLTPNELATVEARRP